LVLLAGLFGRWRQTPALYNGRLYVRDFSDTIFDSQTGTIVGNFNAKNTPAFSGTRGFFLNGPHSFGTFGTLQARDVNTNSVLWSFAGDGHLQSAVLVVNDYVYVGSSLGKLYAVNAANGQQVWVTTAGSSIPYVDEQNVSQPLTSFAAAEGLLVVPTSTTLVAYEGDTTPPTLTWGSLTPAANAAGWNNTAVDFAFTTADDLSGVQSSVPDSPLHFTLEGANQTQQVTVTDKAGNSATFTAPAVNIDLTKPLTSAIVSGTSNNTWYRGPVSVTLNASDNLSGVAGTFYKIDGGSAQTYTSPFSISSDGVHTVDFWSVDNAGNTEVTHSLAVNIDTAAPLVTATASPETAAKSPRPVTVTISGNAADGLSGISSASYSVIDEYGVTHPSGPVTLQANGNYSFTLSLPATKNGPDKDGHLYTIIVSGFDQAGNSGSATATVRIN
jgi:PQQ-like domain/Bacterial Ig-like domain